MLRSKVGRRWAATYLGTRIRKRKLSSGRRFTKSRRKMASKRKAAAASEPGDTEERNTAPSTVEDHQPLGTGGFAIVGAAAPAIPVEAQYDPSVLRSYTKAKVFVEKVEYMRRMYKVPGIHKEIIDGSAFFPTRAAEALTKAVARADNAGPCTIHEVTRLGFFFKADVIKAFFMTR